MQSGIIQTITGVLSLAWALSYCLTLFPQCHLDEKHQELLPAASRGSKIQVELRTKYRIKNLSTLILLGYPHSEDNMTLDDACGVKLYVPQHADFRQQNDQQTLTSTNT